VSLGDDNAPFLTDTLGGSYQKRPFAIQQRTRASSGQAASLSVLTATPV
jgi:hypothetical protein